MDRIARFIVHRSRVVLGLTAAVTLIAVAMLFRLDFNADVASFILEGTPTGQELEALQDKYETTDPINVVASLPDGVTYADSEGLVLLYDLVASLESTAGVEGVASVLPEANPITGQAITREAIAALPADAASSFFSLNPLSSLLLSEDLQDTLVIVIPGDDPTATARDVITVEVEGMTTLYSGNPVIFASVIDLLSLFLLLIPPLVIVLLIATFYLNIGDRRLSVLAILPAVIGSIWTFGLIFGLGFKADIVTVIVPIFVIVMGSADGLHFVSHFQDSARNPDPVSRVSRALSHVGVPMILTTISTAAGFLSLTLTDVGPIRQLGLFTAVGIGFAGVVSFFTLPALLSHVKVKHEAHRAVLGPRVTGAIKSLVRTRTPAIVLTALIVVFGAFTLPDLDVNSDQLFFFKPNDPVRVAFEQTAEIFGGATPMIGEFVFDPSGQPSQLEEIRRVSAELEDLPGVRVVFSAADIAGQLPPDQATAVLSGEVDLAIGKMVSEDGLRFTLLPEEFDSEELRGWIEYAESTPEVRILTGMPLVWDEIARVVLDAQLVSLLVAFLLVAALLAIAYRRVRETLASLVPIALTVVTVLGFISISGIQLNLLTAVVSSIVLGVGIDYAIHYVAAIDIARRDGPGYVFRAIDSAGRPIVANALGIAVALTALWLSPLLIHSQVSMIMWVAMITAALTALVVIPALLPGEGTEPEK